MLCAGNVHYMNVRKPVIPLSKADAQLMQRSAGLVRSASAILIAHCVCVCAVFVFKYSSVQCSQCAH